MKRRLLRATGVAIALLVGTPATWAQQASQREVNELKRALEAQEQSIRELKERIKRMEAEPKPAAPVAPAPVVTKPGEAPAPADEAEARMATTYGRQVPVRNRATFDDKQEAASRPEDFTLDPEYRGFIPIPNTVFMIKFNPRPRVDLTLDTQNSGNDFRFVPATIPLEGTPPHGGGANFNINGNGSQLRLDMRAPSVAGNFRFYYQNDFFGSDTRNFQYRLQHLYGQYQGLVAGFTYGVFEDPDAWPDTLDYEGPNSVIFARRPLVHYKFTLMEDWRLTLGVEDPDSFVDFTGDTTARRRTRFPDGGFNVRWEPTGLGHMQFSSIFRSIGMQSDQFENDDAFGWGFNLAGTINVTDTDSLVFWGVYGHGVGGMGNDSSFVNSDAALDANGDLVALEYISGLLAYTHVWTPRWRSTATYGYAHLENTALQSPDAYNETHYTSINLMYKIMRRFSVGIEGLYGFREVKSGDNGDVFRIQVGMLYSIFD